jgi:hypothetical protein
MAAYGENPMAAVTGIIGIVRKGLAIAVRALALAREYRC